MFTVIVLPKTTVIIYSYIPILSLYIQVFSNLNQDVFLLLFTIWLGLGIICGFFDTGA